MGEVLVSSHGGGGIADTPELTDDGGRLSTTVRWEKFFPKMIFRVLLVEADDSTRQIITALLRKCSYKVAAVSDGLKAWELLKGRSQSIDLILTEVELPSISGFALLTLIMEHQICKNIPVIMMSAHDSVSTVYKCMLRGAADFLVKPIRKNELKNLWQHVWRRQSSTAGSTGRREESDSQQKVEATAENNATSNHSSGYMACIKLNRECIEKGSDAQSSCTKPDVEADGPPMEDGNTVIILDESQQKDDTTKAQEAMDLIGSFDSYPKSSLNYGANKADQPSLMLDLSLRRSHPSSSVNQFSDDRHRLKQSDVSAFSRYVNRAQPPLTSGSGSICNQKDCETNSDRPLSKTAVEYISDTHSAPVGSSQYNVISPHGQPESQFPSPKERVFPVRVLVGSVCAQPELAPMPMETTETVEDHSTSSGFCNGGTLSRLNSIGSGSNGHVSSVIDGNNPHRSIQREAALNKFRMKRKDRCFDKKVRYESRKKLAEQRPRVKGQFVRQGQISNSSPTEI